MEEVSNYLNSLRRDFARQRLDEESVLSDPFEQLAKWLEEAVNAQILDPQAMVLSTVTSDGQPSARVVYLRGLDARGIVFYTNYESEKGRQLAAQPRAALTFYYAEVERQIRIEGVVEEVSAEESDAYFNARPRESQLGAWASAQSETLTSRTQLEGQVAKYTAQFEGQEVTRPPFWGGYRFQPHRFEFWQGRPSRLHDRLVYTQAGESWAMSRLSP